LTFSLPGTCNGKGTDPCPIDFVAPSKEEKLADVCGEPPKSIITMQASSWDSPVEVLSLTHTIASELGQALVLALERGITPKQIASTLKAFPQDCSGFGNQAIHQFKTQEYKWGNVSGEDFSGVRIKPAYITYAHKANLWESSFWSAKYWSSDAGEKENGQKYRPQALRGLELVAPNAVVIGNALEVFLNEYGVSLQLDVASQHTKRTLRKYGIEPHTNGGYFVLPDVKIVHPTNTEYVAEQVGELC